MISFSTEILRIEQSSTFLRWNVSWPARAKLKAENIRLPFLRNNIRDRKKEILWNWVIRVEHLSLPSHSTSVLFPRHCWSDWREGTLEHFSVFLTVRGWDGEAGFYLTPGTCYTVRPLLLPRYGHWPVRNYIWCFWCLVSGVWYYLWSGLVSVERGTSPAWS